MKRMPCPSSPCPDDPCLRCDWGAFLRDPLSGFTCPVFFFYGAESPSLDRLERSPTGFFLSSQLRGCFSWGDQKDLLPLRLRTVYLSLPGSRKIFVRPFSRSRRSKRRPFPPSTVIVSSLCFFISSPEERVISFLLHVSFSLEALFLYPLRCENWTLSLSPCWGVGRLVKLLLLSKITKKYPFRSIYSRGRSEGGPPLLDEFRPFRATSSL